MKGKRACSRIREIDVGKRMAVYMDHELRPLRKGAVASLATRNLTQLTDDMEKEEEGASGPLLVSARAFSERPTCLTMPLLGLSQCRSTIYSGLSRR